MKPRVRPPLPEYVQFLSAYGPEITRLALAVRELVMEEAPDATELIYDAYSAVSAGFTFTGRPSDSFVYIAAYEKRVNLGFFYGASFDDPKKLLQGTGKQSRHLRIEQVADLEHPAVRDFVRVALAEAERPDTEMGETAAKGRSVVQAIYARKRRPAPSKVTRPPARKS